MLYLFHLDPLPRCVPLSRPPAGPRLTFLPRARGELAVPGFQHDGPVMAVVDLAFRVGGGRVAALRVQDEEQPDAFGGGAFVEAMFTTPLRSGRVRVPPPQGRGWLSADPSAVGLRWVSAVRGTCVVDCAGRPLGRVDVVVVDHLRQRITDLLLDDGARFPLDEAVFLGTERVLIDADSLRTGTVDLWLAWQQDLEESRLWWREALTSPPRLEPARSAASL